MEKCGLVFAALLACSVTAVAVFSISGLAEEDNPYVGSSKCKICHIKEYKSWKKTKHAGVFDELSDADKSDPDVLKKRTTGYGKPSGFKSVAETPKLASVGCEACHGRGGKHADIPLDDKEALKATMRAPTDRNVCIECHEPHEKKKKE